MVASRKVIRVPATEVQTGDLIRWRGMFQAVLSVERGDGMPWPAGTKWLAFHLAPPVDELNFGYAPTIVLLEKTRISKAVPLARRFKGHGNTI